jgi:biofilm protein TabA
MKRTIFILMVLLNISVSGKLLAGDPSTWNDKKLDKWFTKTTWLQGWTVKPDNSINKREFAVSYFKNKKRWDNAFKFLKSNNLQNLEVKRYDIDGDNLFATVSEYATKDEATTRFEAHKKYIDIQYVISGKEIMNLSTRSNVSEIVNPYDGTKDIEFMNVSGFKHFDATQDNFFIFFPDDIHRPGIKDGQSKPVRKIVIKVKVD